MVLTFKAPLNEEPFTWISPLACCSNTHRLEYVTLLVYAKYYINSNVIQIRKCSAVTNTATATLTSLIHSNFIHPEILKDIFSCTLS
jgi:hypothetical protein